ncbi:MAG: CDP-diacylglycerol--serine O-phosphatidyltransferase [Bacteroidetes bacterium]|nr:CDP-diacylglycerol--serine O-phosphatidyltransferase [Bacteroidota bacterium]
MVHALPVRRIRGRRAPRRRLTRTAVPSFFTLLNLLSGFFAILQVHQGQLVAAAWLIALAGLFDALDGMMARLMRSASDFGVQLDSLCDVVSFGVAPAFLVYEFALYQMRELGMLLASLPAVTGAVRLARFNVQLVGYEKDYFRGLPIPAQALFLAAFVVTFHDSTLFDSLPMGAGSVLAPGVVLLSLLMISPIRYEALPRPTRQALRQHPVRVTLFMLGAAWVAVFHARGLLMVLGAYILFGFGRALWRLLHTAWLEEPSERSWSRQPPKERQRHDL